MNRSVDIRVSAGGKRWIYRLMAYGHVISSFSCPANVHRWDRVDLWLTSGKLQMTTRGGRHD